MGEEEMVVVGHRGMVEERGTIGLAGIFQENVFGKHIFVRCA